MFFYSVIVLTLRYESRTMFFKIELKACLKQHGVLKHEKAKIIKLLMNFLLKRIIAVLKFDFFIYGLMRENKARLLGIETCQGLLIWEKIVL